ncbi:MULTISPECIES: DUF2065 domain-containing protein [Denitromonas]|jgi:hypothetical protein|uniref:DUF2065 domain-containing protein n=2 Tax=Denitromonas TaxID=139331 RepID=A0A557RCQ1_9RHOO|nr:MULTISPECIES: DUF2065 domain-containing protein [Denitromonas]TVO50905.1 DUF2065 domain-containing protein [Denitromonas halophila]TVO62924.1 DUF2065 domain-containing protein [Denitromonas ohlonensis]TVO74959.1 DUF2065 domain-containing protein [Denitromonas ohlonensis]TVT48968.1 MAG: DUF2065 domain-containing protein [Denitromonas halophila]TVT72052.1 MAG: DUF2065 domain-containing protein [Denitromonas halophila]
MKSSLITAFALMLLIEGVLPFVSPGRWREVFRKAVLMEDGQIRFIGLSSMLIGLILLLVFND